MPVRITPAVKFLLIACAAGFVIQQTVDTYFGGNLLNWLGLVPSGFILGFKFWQIITYSFLHADVPHFILNMLMLAFIGGEIETLWGTKRFLRYYFVCVIAAGLLYLLLQLAVWKGEVPMVGASGGIYGVLMAYGILFGERVLLFMLLFPMKAKHFIWILVAVELMTTLFSRGTGGALSAAAHLGGMAAGFAYLWIEASMSVMRRNRGTSPKGAPKKRKGGSHLKLVIDNKDEPKDPSGPKTWH